MRFKQVILKVGVFDEDKRSKSEFWIEFDPQNRFQLSNNRLLLPFIASTAASIAAPFYIHHMIPKCSSMAAPSGRIPVFEESNYLQASVKACDRYMKQVPREKWTAWDIREPNLPARVKRMSRVCWACSNPMNRTSNRMFPSISLRDVMRSIDHFDLVDIDAQGMDVELVVSLGDLVSKVKRFKIECQTPTETVNNEPYWLYKTTVPNDCGIATRFLSSYGFVVEKLEMNNCACEEQNLYMVFRNHSKAPRTR